MPWDDFARMRVPVPSYEEQLEIVRNYEAISERIELKKKINDNLAPNCYYRDFSMRIRYEKSVRRILHQGELGTFSMPLHGK